MRKFFIYLLLFISIFLIILRVGSQNINKLFNIKSRAGLRIETTPKAIVTIDGKNVGTTPLDDDDLVEGEYLVTLVASESESSNAARWKGYVKLNPGTLTIVNRELSNTVTGSSGEMITLEDGKGLTVLSNPTNAEVFVDNDNVGRTPLYLPDISVGGHRIVISRENYLKRSINATTVNGYNLILSVDLALTEADLTQTPITPITTTAQLTVKKTPTGFLRIRESANINSKEVGQVKPGDILILLEEQPNWDRVRTSDGKEGWVSSSYVEKKVQ